MFGSIGPGFLAMNPIGDKQGLDPRSIGAFDVGQEAVADGVHGEETRPYTAVHMEALFTRFGVKASAVTRALKW